jgi:hypothetical protein
LVVGKKKGCGKKKVRVKTQRTQNTYPSVRTAKSLPVALYNGESGW